MRWSFFRCCSCDGDMRRSQSTKNKQKHRVVILGLGDLGIRFAPTVAERGLATDLKLVSRGEVAVEWAQLLRLGTDCRVSRQRTDGLDVAGMRNVLGSFEPDLIMQCASLLSPFTLLESGAPAAVGIMKAGFAANCSAAANHRDPDARACESGAVLPGDPLFVFRILATRYIVAIRFGTDGRNWQRDDRSSFGGSARETRERQVADHRAPRARHTVSDRDACRAGPSFTHRGQKRREARRRRSRDSL